jgi:hypothetical protein
MMPAARRTQKAIVINMPKNALRNTKTVKIVYAEIRVKSRKLQWRSNAQFFGRHGDTAMESKFFERKNEYTWTVDHRPAVMSQTEPIRKWGKKETKATN